MRTLLLFFLIAMRIHPVTARAEDPIVFISAFASGDKGAIHAFRFATKTGDLKPLHRTTDIRNPFFLAISPDRHFLYAIDTEKFGGPQD